MKKDKEWLKKELDKSTTGFNGRELGRYEMGRLDGYTHASMLIDQLDEPDERTQLEEAYKDILERHIFYYNKDKYQVIKEQIIPKFVADWIEENHGYNIYGALSAVDKETHSQVHDWVFVKGGINDFTRAWLDGYTVE